jgi:hypothetical protein
LTYAGDGKNDLLRYTIYIKGTWMNSKVNPNEKFIYESVELLKAQMLSFSILFSRKMA